MMNPSNPKGPAKTPEPENQEKDFSTKSGAFAIVDAAMLKDIDSPYTKEAVIIPVKHKDAVFTVKADYDDTILRSLTMAPKPSETEPEALAQPGHEDHKDGDIPQEVTPPEVAKQQGVPVEESEMPPDIRKFEQLLSFIASSYNISTSEVAHKLMAADIRSWSDWQQAVQQHGIPVGLNFPKSQPQSSVTAEGNASPLSHDDSVQRSLRKHQTPRSRRHMKGSDLYRRGDPVKKAMARVKRVGRQEAKPEVEDAFQFLISNSGKQLSEEQLKGVKDQVLLSEVLDLMLAMTFKNWTTDKNAVTNGDYILEDERFKVAEGALLFNDKPINLEFDWLYGVRQQVKALVLKQPWDLNKLVK